MYSRFPKNSDRPIRLPEHYSGCAFTECEEKETPPPLPISQEPPHEDKKTPMEAPRLPLGVASIFTRALPFSSGGLNFEELLLIGLIILLARTEQESDVILWLALLLFCK